MHTDLLHILAIDDQDFDAESLRRHLTQVPGLAMKFRAFTDPEEGLASLEREPTDVIFLDYRLDGATTGLDLVRTLRAKGDLRPIIVLTGQGDEYLAVEITRSGADDYLVKSDLAPELLRRAIEIGEAQHHARQAEQELARRHEEIRKLTQELSEANVRLAQMTRTDYLTGLMNRRSWEEAIEIEHERSLRRGHAYSIIILDVDHFKEFNDTQGHQAGDECLRRLASSLRSVTRAADFVGRYGGEEFVVLCPETSEAEALHLSERIRAGLEAMAMPHPASPTSAYVTASLGVVAGPAPTWEEAVSLADRALYDAKRAGRNRACIHESHDVDVDVAGADEEASLDDHEARSDPPSKPRGFRAGRNASR